MRVAGCRNRNRAKQLSLGSGARVCLVDRYRDVPADPGTLPYSPVSTLGWERPRIPCEKGVITGLFNIGELAVVLNYYSVRYNSSLLQRVVISKIFAFYAINRCSYLPFFIPLMPINTLHA